MSVNEVTWTRHLRMRAGSFQSHPHLPTPDLWEREGLEVESVANGYDLISMST